MTGLDGRYDPNGLASESVSIYILYFVLLGKISIAESFICVISAAMLTVNFTLSDLVRVYCMPDLANPIHVSCSPITFSLVNGKESVH